MPLALGRQRPFCMGGEHDLAQARAAARPGGAKRRLLKRVTWSYADGRRR